jgi:hypothetical protein
MKGREKYFTFCKKRFIHENNSDKFVQAEKTFKISPFYAVLLIILSLKPVRDLNQLEE